MATETVHIVQAYVQAKNGVVRAEPQIGCKDAEEARRKAERLAPLRHGVVGAVSLTIKVLHFEGCKPLVEKAFYETAIV